MNKTYSIGEVAEMFHLSISTLHYYDKKGLLPFVEKNDSGHRAFTESDLQFIQTICCLKDTDMPIKDIRTYINYCMEGPSTIEKRKALLLAHKRQVLAKQEKIIKSLEGIDQKIEHYSLKNADFFIEEQLAYAMEEKRINHLANPFKKVSFSSKQKSP